MFVIGLLCRCFRHRSVNSRHQNWICLISMNILHLRKPDLHSWPTNVSNSQHLWMLFDACLLFVNPLWMWYILWSCCFSQMSQGSIWAVDLPVSPLLSTQPCLFVPARLVSHAPAAAAARAVYFRPQLAAYRLCLPCRTIRPSKPRPWSHIATILSLIVWLKRCILNRHCYVLSNSGLSNATVTDLFTYLGRLSLQNLKIAKIRICAPLKSDVNFRFVWEQIGIEPTTFPSHTQNLVKIEYAYTIVGELMKLILKP